MWYWSGTAIRRCARTGMLDIRRRRGRISWLRSGLPHFCLVRISPAVRSREVEEIFRGSLTRDHDRAGPRWLRHHRHQADGLLLQPDKVAQL